jgi:hypothetical protein
MISFRELTYPQIGERMEWVEENIGPRKYYLHIAQGGEGWSYNSNSRTITINDRQWELLYILKWGA